MLFTTHKLHRGWLWVPLFGWQELGGANWGLEVGQPQTTRRTIKQLFFTAYRRAFV